MILDKLNRFAAIHVPPRVHYCVICDRQISRFLPYRNGIAGQAPLMRALAVVDGDLLNFTCPHCFSHSRERHLLLYMRASGLLASTLGSHILHFAPEAGLARVFAAHSPLRHVMCDLIPAAPGIERVDIRATHFDDGEFDFVLANHVIEHVDDERSALSEIARILKPGGYAILQTPFSPMLRHAWEDKGVVEEGARFQAFGQEDHVRLYGQDIFQRFESTGLVARIRTHEELLPQYDGARYGINTNEPFFLFQRV